MGKQSIAAFRIQTLKTRKASTCKTWDLALLILWLWRAIDADSTICKRIRVKSAISKRSSCKTLALAITYRIVDQSLTQEMAIHNNNLGSRRQNFSNRLVLRMKYWQAPKTAKKFVTQSKMAKLSDPPLSTVLITQSSIMRLPWVITDSPPSENIIWTHSISEDRLSDLRHGLKPQAQCVWQTTI